MQEREILACRDGRLTEQLVLSDHTVRVHIRSAMKQLGCHAALEAVTVSLRHGWIELPTSWRGC